MTRTLAGVAAMLAATLALVACTSSSSSPHAPTATLRAPIDGQVSGEIPSVKANVPVVIPMPNLCTTGSPIIITAITVIRPTGGLHLVDWGTRSREPGDNYTNTDNVGGANGLVHQFRGFDHHPVTARCGHAETATHRTELDISIATPTPRGVTTGVHFSYRAGATQKTLAIPYGLTLCTTQKCPPPEHSNTSTTP